MEPTIPPSHARHGIVLPKKVLWYLDSKLFYHISGSQGKRDRDSHNEQGDGCRRGLLRSHCDAPSRADLGPSRTQQVQQDVGEIGLPTCSAQLTPMYPVHQLCSPCNTITSIPDIHPPKICERRDGTKKARPPPPPAPPPPPPPTLGDILEARLIPPSID